MKLKMGIIAIPVFLCTLASCSILSPGNEVPVPTVETPTSEYDYTEKVKIENLSMLTDSFYRNRSLELLGEGSKTDNPVWSTWIKPGVMKASVLVTGYMVTGDVKELMYELDLSDVQELIAFKANIKKSLQFRVGDYNSIDELIPLIKKEISLTDSNGNPLEYELKLTNDILLTVAGDYELDVRLEAKNYKIVTEIKVPVKIIEPIVTHEIKFFDMELNLLASIDIEAETEFTIQSAFSEAMNKSMYVVKAYKRTETGKVALETDTLISLNEDVEIFLEYKEGGTPARLVLMYNLPHDVTGEDMKVLHPKLCDRYTENDLSHELYLNYVFGGWFSSPTFEEETEVVPGMLVKPDLTLYAKWIRRR